MLPEPEAEKEAKYSPIDISDFFTPNVGPQTEFLESTCTEVLYGGAAGGGKSAAITALPLKWAHLPGFQAITLRRTFPQTGQLRKYSRELYRAAFPGLKPNKNEGHLWTFPSGAEASYGHCQNTDDHEKYDGAEFNLVCFDELTHFTKTQYDYISARVRSSDPALPTYIRATTNPGGSGHEWVFAHWGAWLNPEFEGVGLQARRDENGANDPPAKPGQVLWVRSVDGVDEYFYSDPGFTENPAISRTFIPAMLADNPHLAKNDPTYHAKLSKLDPVRRAQLQGGDWLVRPAAGLFFNRNWIGFVDAIPAGARKIRCWDLAATEKKSTGDDPDWTAGGIVAIHDNIIYIDDVIRRRITPGEVEKLILSTAEMDGKSVTIGLPQDPGQAGKSQIAAYVKLLRGFTIDARTETGDKVTRYGPFSSQAEHGNVRLVRGTWNKSYIEESEAFPTKGIHDDQVDFTSGGFNRLAKPLAARGGVEFFF